MNEYVSLQKKTAKLAYGMDLHTVCATYVNNMHYYIVN